MEWAGFSTTHWWKEKGLLNIWRVQGHCLHAFVVRRVAQCFSIKMEAGITYTAHVLAVICADFASSLPQKDLVVTFSIIQTSARTFIAFPPPIHSHSQFSKTNYNFLSEIQVWHGWLVYFAVCFHASTILMSGELVKVAEGHGLLPWIES